MNGRIQYMEVAMNKDNIVCVARKSLSEQYDYYPCDTYGLQVKLLGNKENTNSVCTEKRVRITNTLKDDFKGVVHLKLMVGIQRLV